MPYIRVYSRELAIEEKRAIARDMITIVLSAFQLRPQQRDKITVQFLPRTPREASSAVLVEVSDHSLSSRLISDFVGAATAMLNKSAAVKPASLLERWLGLAPDPARLVSFEFRDTRDQDVYVGGEHFAALTRRAA